MKTIWGSDCVDGVRAVKNEEDGVRTAVEKAEAVIKLYRTGRPRVR